MTKKLFWVIATLFLVQVATLGVIGFVPGFNSPEKIETAMWFVSAIMMIGLAQAAVGVTILSGKVWAHVPAALACTLLGAIALVVGMATQEMLIGTRPAPYMSFLATYYGMILAAFGFLALLHMAIMVTPVVLQLAKLMRQPKQT